MTNEAFEAEQRYQASLAIAKSLLKEGLITNTEFDEIDAFLLRKHRPPLGSLFSDNA